MPILRRPSKKLINKTIHPFQRRLPQQSVPFHQRTIQGAKTLGAMTGKGIKAAKKMHGEIKRIGAFGKTASPSIASKFYFSNFEKEELEQYFGQLHEQFQGNEQALLEAMSEANILPEMFEDIEHKMTKQERLEIIKLLKKYLNALRADENEARKIAIEARDFISKIRIRENF